MLDGYLHAGRILVARCDWQVVGHLQLVDTGHVGEAEIKNMAVRPDHQGRGIGSALIRAAVAAVTADDETMVVVATAAADVGNLRFYQRCGFRMRRVERDAFTAGTGYPDEIQINGIALRDRVWLDRDLR